MSSLTVPLHAKSLSYVQTSCIFFSEQKKLLIFDIISHKQYDTVVCHSLYYLICLNIFPFAFVSVGKAKN